MWRRDADGKVIPHVSLQERKRRTAERKQQQDATAAAHGWVPGSADAVPRSDALRSARKASKSAQRVRETQQQHGRQLRLQATHSARSIDPFVALMEPRQGRCLLAQLLVLDALKDAAAHRPTYQPGGNYNDAWRLLHWDQHALRALVAWAERFPPNGTLQWVVNLRRLASFVVAPRHGAKLGGCTWCDTQQLLLLFAGSEYQNNQAMQNNLQMVEAMEASAQPMYPLPSEWVFIPEVATCLSPTAVEDAVNGL